MPSVDIVVPLEQEGTTAVVKTWLKQIGEPVRVNDPVVEIETDKVAVEIAAAADGVLSEILLEPGTEVEPGTILGRIADRAAPRRDDAPAALAPARPRAASTSGRGHDQLPPGIRRMLSEHGLDADAVPARGDKLTREDIQAEIDRRARAPKSGATLAGKKIPHDSMRKRIAEHLTRSVREAPHVTAVFEADMSAVIAHREANKAAFQREGANLTFTAYFVAASVAAMKAGAAINGRWFEDHIEIYDDVNIGVGTALGDKGLIVPVIHRAQTLSLLETARRLTELTEKARSGKLSPGDVQNGTFSISNHGVSGSLIAAPIIINQPQSAILGVGKLQKRAVVREIDGLDSVVVRPQIYVSLTIDHRVIDAHQTNSWLTRFVEVVETWPP